MDVCKALVFGLVAVQALLLGSLAALQSTSCNYSILCSDSFLALLKLFPDSKSIVDRPLLVSPALLEAQLHTSLLTGNGTAAQQVFLSLSSPPGSDLLPWHPPDWKASPPSLAKVKDPRLKLWSHQIHLHWPELGRKVSPAVLAHPDRHSLLPLPEPFILAGPHAREPLYWQSLWLVLGLLHGGMHTTAKLIMTNMAASIYRFGFVPSGGRVYFTGRSQPPVLTQMVELYFNMTSDLSFVEEVLPALYKEYDFWMRHRSVTMSGATFNLYQSPSRQPRLEAYQEDIALARRMPPENRGDFYSEVASASESGWLFSSRWLNPGPANMSSLRTRRILPVDLNALLGQNELSLYKLCSVSAGQAVRARMFLSAHQRRCRVFDSVFWSKERGLWLDVDLDNGSHVEGFYASSLVPLLWGCGVEQGQHVAVLAAMQRLGLLHFPGGIPASLNREAGLQWDFPHAIAPLQWFPVVAWARSPRPALRQAAKTIAQRWISSTYHSWRRYNTMFDKYLCTEFGIPAGGTEQHNAWNGFGWSSGVVLDFLSLYPDTFLEEDEVDVKDDEVSDSAATSSAAQHLSIPSSLERYSLEAAIVAIASSNMTSDPSSGPALAWLAAPVLVLAVLGIFIACLGWCRWLFVTGQRRYWGRVHSEQQQGTGGQMETSTRRESSEETDEFNDNDRRELFSRNP